MTVFVSTEDAVGITAAARGNVEIAAPVLGEPAELFEIKPSRQQGAKINNPQYIPGRG